MSLKHILLRRNDKKRREVYCVPRSSVVDKIPNPSSSFKTCLFKILYTFIWYFYPVPIVSYIYTMVYADIGKEPLKDPGSNQSVLPQEKDSTRTAVYFTIS